MPFEDNSVDNEHDSSGYCSHGVSHAEHCLICQPPHQIRVAEIDYRVDQNKLTFQKPYTGAVPLGYHRPEPQILPPVQCPARYHLIESRFSWWERLMRVFFDKRPLHVIRQDELYGEQCVMYDGHWFTEGQRTHINAYGERWPVTAADTQRLNPDD